MVNKYTYKEAYEDSLVYFKNDLSAKAFVDKYILRDNEENILESNPDDMHQRIASELARIEKSKFKNPLSYDQIYSHLKDFKEIIPQGSPMYGIGNTYQYASLSNCFVAESPVDSYGGIHYTDEQLTQLSKRRCGVGISLDNLRPEGTPTKNSSRHSTGILSWMNRYSNSIREVGQGGRRGALMLTLNVHHPQVLDFINAKSDITKITGANVSTQYTDDFLNAVENDAEYEQRWPIYSDSPSIFTKTKAKTIWDAAVKAAWSMGEPGVQFIDNVLRESPADCYAKFGFRTISSNPCSEIYLSALDSCRLLLINIFSCIKNPFSNESEFDYERLADLSHIAQRLMDDIVDLELECIDRIIAKVKTDPERDGIKQRELSMWVKIREVCVNGRRTGTGITALGDALAALGVKYDSEEAIETVDKIYMVLKLSCYRTSVEMAKELGPFPIWDHELEKDNPFLNRIKDEKVSLHCCSPGLCESWLDGKEIYEDMKKYGRRNIALLTTPPAGTTSLLACLDSEARWFGTTSGIEPLFMGSYTRRKKGNPGDKDFRSDFVDQNGDHWMEFEVYHAGLEMYKNISGDHALENNPYVYAPNINWENRVRLQAAAQRHIDHSISSTVNLPNDVKVEEVDKIFRAAWKSGLKGITVYRDGCRTGVLVNKQEDVNDRPKELPCELKHITVKGQPYFVLIGLKDEKPYELFAGHNGFMKKKHTHGSIIKKRSGLYKAVLNDDFELSPVTDYTTDEEDVVCRQVSLLLRSGVDIKLICEQLNKSKGDLTGISKGIARVLYKYIKDGEESWESCPECKQKLVFESGCKICKNCSYAACG